MPSPDDAPARAPEPAADKPKRDTYRIVYTPALLAELRQLYEETPLSLDEIAAPRGMSRRTLAMKAEREGWVRFERPALDLSPAAKLDARLKQAELSLSLPREPSFPRPPRALASGGEGIGVGGSLPNCEAAPPNPDPSPPLASPMGGGEKDFDSRFQRMAEDALATAEGLIANLNAARLQMEETGRYAQAAALGRDLASITNSLYRIKRLYAGAPAGALDDDDSITDLDARRDALARRIEIIVAEWRDAEAAGRPDGA